MDEHRYARDDGATRAEAHRCDTGELAESRLRRSAYLALQRLSCEFHAGVLTLRGRLPRPFVIDREPDDRPAGRRT